MLYALLFPDAEVGEDVAEDVVGGDAAGDFGEGGDGGADILGQELLRDARLQGAECRLDIVVSAAQGLEVAHIRHHDISPIQAFGIDRFTQSLTQSIDSLAISSRDIDCTLDASF